MSYQVTFKIPETQLEVRFSGSSQNGPLKSEHAELNAAVYWSPDDGYRAWINVGRLAVLSPRTNTHTQALEYCCNRLRRIST
jgi:hypothetical protein